MQSIVTIVTHRHQSRFPVTRRGWTVVRRSSKWCSGGTEHYTMPHPLFPRWEECQGGGPPRFMSSHCFKIRSSTAVNASGKAIPMDGGGLPPDVIGLRSLGSGIRMKKGITEEYIEYFLGTKADLKKYVDHP